MKRLINYLRPFFNLKFLICFLLAWSITNGWCYVFIAVGKFANIQWMLNIGLGYLAFLWLPCTPEKLVSIPLALIFHRWFFSKDEKSKQLLLNMKEQAKEDWNKIKNKFKRVK